MHKLVALYEEFESIKAMQCGDGTDWPEVRRRLSSLYARVANLKIPYSAHSRFYLWVHAELKKEVALEYDRVDLILRRGERK